MWVSHIRAILGPVQIGTESLDFYIKYSEKPHQNNEDTIEYNRSWHNRLKPAVYRRLFLPQLVYTIQYIPRVRILRGSKLD